MLNSNKLYLVLFFLTSCFSIFAQVNSESDCVESVETDSLSSIDVTTTCVYFSGCDPIVLDFSTLSDLGVREIEIRDSLFDVKYREVLPVSLSVKFNQMGVFNGFSLATLEDEGFLRDKWKAKMDVSVIRNQNLGDFPEYTDSLSISFVKSPQSFESDEMSSILDKFQVYPFIGASGYIFRDSITNRYTSNTISLKKEELDEKQNSELGYVVNYTISKSLKSDIDNITKYNLEGNDEQFWKLLRSQQEINIRLNDTSEIQYYYYGRNPLFTFQYTKERRAEDEEEEYVFYHQYTYLDYFKDTIYNKNRWLGFSSDDLSLVDYYGNVINETHVVDDSEFVESFFSGKKITRVSSNEFYINGKLGYSFLLEAYNNRKVLVYENVNNEYDKDGQLIPDEYKQQKELEALEKLPRRIVVQLTLTDFWLIETSE